MIATPRSARIKNLGALVCVFALLAAANAQTVRLHGSVSLAKTIDGKKAALESQTGVKLEVVGNGAGRGLADLSGGQADIALLAGPLQGVAEAMNKDKAGSVDTARMKEIPLMTTRMGFYTHPSAGVKSLTMAQIRSVFTGAVANWKEVGGADLPIKVVLAFGADGTRVAVRQELFPETDYVKTAIVRNSAKDVPAVLAQLPGACAVLSVQNADGNIADIALERELKLGWSMVVLGDPAGDIKKVIDAVTPVIK